MIPGSFPSQIVIQNAQKNTRGAQNDGILGFLNGALGWDSVDRVGEKSYTTVALAMAYNSDERRETKAIQEGGMGRTD